jgi:hypothetical protein
VSVAGGGWVISLSRWPPGVFALHPSRHFATLSVWVLRPLYCAATDGVCLQESQSPQGRSVSLGFMLVVAMFVSSVVQTVALHQCVPIGAHVFGCVRVCKGVCWGGGQAISLFTSVIPPAPPSTSPPSSPCAPRYFFRVLRVGMNLRSAVIAAVYRKSIAVSITSRQSSSTGELVNIMSTGAAPPLSVADDLSAITHPPPCPTPHPHPRFVPSLPGTLCSCLPSFCFCMFACAGVQTLSDCRT